MKKVRKVTKGNNNIVFNVSILFIIFIFFGIITNFCFANGSLQTQTFLVNSNDTIWEIAKDICKDNDKLNIQNVVIQIKEINNLKTSDIYVGQILNIPIY